jgi:hypothetical protein
MDQHGTAELLTLFYFAHVEKLMSRTPGKRQADSSAEVDFST